MTFDTSHRFGIALLLASFVVLVLSCSTIDCPVQNTVYTVYTIGATEQRDTLHDTLYVWTPRRDGKDTLLNRGVGLTKFNLPISYQHPEDTLVFVLADTVGFWALDTVWIKKDDIPHFESVDCNPSFFHQITAVRSTHRGIDSIYINHSLVDYDPSTEHFHIVFKTRR